MAFLASIAMMDRLGLIISCVPVCAGYMELGLELGFGGFNPMFSTAELTSRGVEPFLPLRLTFLVVRKMRAPLRATSVTLAFGSTVWREPKISQILDGSSVTSCSSGRIAAGAVIGTNRLINNVCVKSQLIV